MNATGADAAATPAVLAVDVGNSKTDVALLADDGNVLGAVRGPTTSHQAVGLEAGMALLERLVAVAAVAAGVALDAPHGRAVARVLAYCAAGVDLPRDERVLGRALAERGFAPRQVVLNDTFAALRAGSARGWGVAIICGSGVNCAGRSPDGRTYRLPALGWISGDRGGGTDVGRSGLAAAVRARDGRGPRTVLERAVPAAFGLRRPIDVTVALYEGRLPESRIGELSPVVFAAAAGGDAVARGIVDGLADELATMAAAAIRRLGLARRDPDVVLGGGVFRTDDVAFHERLGRGIAMVAPRATLRRLDAPPVLGSALVGFDALDVADRAAVDAVLRRSLTDDRLAARGTDAGDRPAGRPA